MSKKKPTTPGGQPDPGSPSPAVPIPTSLEALAHDPGNPREIDPANADGLGHSLETFGELGVIAFNLESGQLVSGHQRVTQLSRKYGPLSIERIDEEFGKITTPDGNTFLVRFVRWDASKQRAANVAANSQTIQGRFVDDKLQLILGDVRESRPEDFDAMMFAELFGVATHGGDAGKLKPQPVAKPPSFAWVLVGIPLADFAEINETVEALAKNPKVTMSITANNGNKD
jgi:hypothetical protein